VSRFCGPRWTRAERAGLAGHAVGDAAEEAAEKLDRVRIRSVRRASSKTRVVVSCANNNYYVTIIIIIMAGNNYCYYSMRPMTYNCV